MSVSWPVYNEACCWVLTWRPLSVTAQAPLHTTWPPSVQPIRSAAAVLLENSLETADSLPTAQNKGPAWDYTTPPPFCPNLLPGHQKASVLTVAITLIGLTHWANIPAIRYTSKHDRKYAPWHWVNMLANWRNAKWDSSKRRVSAATDRRGTSIKSFCRDLVLAISDPAGPGLTDGALNLNVHCSPFGDDASKWKIESY